MKSLCRTLSYVELITGTIGSIFLSNKLGVEVNFRTLDLERDISSTITIFVSSMLCVITFWVILYAISEILENQSRIIELVQSSTKTSPQNNSPLCGPASQNINQISPQPMPLVSELKHNNPENTKTSSEEWGKYGDWNCPNCKRINDSSIAICNCGEPRSK